MAPEFALAAEEGGGTAEDLLAGARARQAANPGDFAPGGSRSRSGSVKRSSKLGSEIAAKVRANRPSAADVREYERGGSQPVGQSGGGFRAGHAVKAARAARSVSLPNVGSQSGRADIVVRIIIALGVAIVALEVASYVTGRYFNWNLKAGASRIQDAGTMIGLYPGQQAKIQGAVAAAKVAPSAPVVAAASPYVGHGVATL